VEELLLVLSVDDRRYKDAEQNIFLMSLCQL